MIQFTAHVGSGDLPRSPEVNVSLDSFYEERIVDLRMEVGGEGVIYKLDVRQAEALALALQAAVRAGRR